MADTNLTNVHNLFYIMEDLYKFYFLVLLINSQFNSTQLSEEW